MTLKTLDMIGLRTAGWAAGMGTDVEEIYTFEAGKYYDFEFMYKTLTETPKTLDISWKWGSNAYEVIPATNLFIYERVGGQVYDVIVVNPSVPAKASFIMVGTQTLDNPVTFVL